MAYYDYKVVSAPQRSKKAKGISNPADLFALTLTDAINEHARQGWEYLRAESLPTQTPRGLLKRPTEDSVSVLVFRRERAAMEPQLEAAAPYPAARTAPAVSFSPEPPEPQMDSDFEEAPEPANAGPRPFNERVQEAGIRRRQPQVTSSDTTPSPLRPSPRLGPVTRD